MQLDITELQSLLAISDQKKKFLEQELQENKSKYFLMNEEAVLLEKIQLLLQNLEVTFRGKFIGFIEELISYGITLVFEEELKFIIEYGKRANTPTVEFFIESVNGKMPLYRSSSGGIRDVISFLLRMILLIHAKPKLKKIMFLDEAFIGVSENYLPNVARLLREFADKLGVTFVLMSHHGVALFQSISDVIYNVEQTKGVTHIQKIEGKLNATY